jgi:hypothetical protein
MTLPKSGRRGGEEGKGLGDLGGEPSPGLGGVVEFGPVNEGDRQIIDRGHYFASIADGHARGVFFEGDVAAIM